MNWLADQMPKMPELPKLPSMDELLDQAKVGAQDLLASALTDKRLGKLVDEDPGFLKIFLDRAHENVRAWQTENGQIDKEIVRKKLTVHQKFELLVSHWFASVAFRKFPKQTTEFSSFEDYKAWAKDKDVTLVDGNALLIGGTLPQMSKDRGLWDLATKFPSFFQSLQENVLAAKNLRMVPGSFLVLQSGKKADKETYYVKMLAEANQLKFEYLSPGDALPNPPSKDTFYFVKVDLEKGLLKPGAVDMNAIAWYTKIFDQGKAQWMTPNLTAAVLVAKGKSISEALSLVGDEQNTDSKLIEVLTQVAAHFQTPTAPTPAVPDAPTTQNT